MATWNSRGLRGSTLEELVNRTNEQYREKGLALIQKIPTPITPVKMDKNNRHITLAYFEQRSTVDYIGAVQGIPICFDAKECSVNTFPLANIHEHQVAFMQDFEKQGGLAFFLLYFSADDTFYYLPLRELMKFWKRREEGGRKSFRREELPGEYYLNKKSGCLVPYLEGIALDLKMRD
ncbi:MAG: Holliday junction resolvase RecU [Lachnospiraceae bacterium]|nr:Holliday junction resolvase RecU [Lachnospiraceae bacterium]